MSFKPCKMQPYNVGLECTAHEGCESCGWNPQIAAARLEKRKAKEAEKYALLHPDEADPDGDVAGEGN